MNEPISSHGWLASHYHDNATEFKRQRDKATEQLSLAKDTIADMQTRQREVAALDAKYTKELADAKAENDALQRKLDNGGRVLVKGKCPVSASTQTAGAPSNLYGGQFINRVALLMALTTGTEPWQHRTGRPSRRRTGPG
ncbi:lysis system i-spanin subunit Rz [Klebsiella pneumoniae]|uniref:lysis system i-spanin subunit Rz n=1 Tax=Klebsiella pneumoniae TaxID=573 RepID=UPI0031FD4600